MRNARAIGTWQHCDDPNREMIGEHCAAPTLNASVGRFVRSELGQTLNSP
jgi:hypothetical protein